MHLRSGRLSRVWLFLLLFVATSAAPLRAQVARLGWTWSWGGFQHGRRWGPLELRVSAARRPLQGEIEARCARAVFRRRIQVPAGGDHLFDMAVPDKPSAVFFRPDDDEEIKGQPEGIASRPIHDNAVLTLVVTEASRHYGCTWLTADAQSKSGFVREAHRVFVTPIRLPTSSLALDGVDMIVLGPGEWTRVGRRRQDALVAWVLSGGHLVVPMGGRPDRFRGTVVEELLPVRLEGSVRLSSAMSLARTFGPEEDMEPLGDLRPFQVTRGRPRRGARVLASEGDVPLLCRWRYGDGEVSFLATGLFDSPLADRGGRVRRQIWEEEMRRARLHRMGRLRPQLDSLTYDDRELDERWNRLRRALAVEDLQAPSSLILLAFILTYLVVIGPLQYFVLARMKRLEAAWLVTPVAVLLFSLVAFAIGSFRGGSDSVLSALTVWHRQEDCRYGRRLRFFKVFSDWNRDYAFRAVGRDASVTPFPSMNAYTWQNLPWVGRPRWSEDGLSLEAHPIHLWAEAAFVASDLVEDGPRIQSDLRREGERITGWIANRGEQVLSHVQLVVGKKAATLTKRLDVGQRLDVDVTVAFHAVPRFQVFRDLVQRGNFWADHLDEELDERVALVAVTSTDDLPSIRPETDRVRQVGLLVQTVGFTEDRDGRRVLDQIPILFKGGQTAASLQVPENGTVGGRIAVGSALRRQGGTLLEIQFFAGRSNLEWELRSFVHQTGKWESTRLQRMQGESMRKILSITRPEGMLDEEGLLLFEVKNLNNYCRLDLDNLHVRIFVSRKEGP